MWREPARGAGGPCGSGGRAGLSPAVTVAAPCRKRDASLSAASSLLMALSCSVPSLATDDWDDKGRWGWVVALGWAYGL